LLWQLRPNLPFGNRTWCSHQVGVSSMARVCLRDKGVQMFGYRYRTTCLEGLLSPDLKSWKIQPSIYGSFRICLGLV
jgi:hypothetical protein